MSRVGFREFFAISAASSAHRPEINTVDRLRSQLRITRFHPFIYGSDAELSFHYQPNEENYSWPNN